MKNRLMNAALWLARACGLFWLAGRLSAQELRILCYHGISYADEHEFWPGVFMRREQFAQRMALLKRLGYPVLGLGAAVTGLEKGTLPPRATVITIDDGWLGSIEHMWPILQQEQFPATLYVSSYYIQHQYPVANVVLAYLNWKAQKNTLTAAALNACVSAQQRQTLLLQSAAELGIDLQALQDSGAFMYATGEQLTNAAAAGLDMQLHTHRHQYDGLDREQTQKEIDDNRAALVALGITNTTHFCYPSGGHQAQHADWLQACGIRSATTCVSELNPVGTHPLFLNRFLDDDKISAIRFEAELCGFLPLLRRALNKQPRPSAAGT